MTKLSLAMHVVGECRCSYHSPETVELEMNPSNVLCSSLSGGMTLENFDVENAESYGWN